ncbi:MAG: TIGR01212 family radical SAM protein [Bacteroidales bacterium]|nr:TIGR01212 family radical SAM protein [Bacteroidales bacterium]
MAYVGKGVKHIDRMLTYTDYSAYLSRYFSGKMQKLTIDARFTCPNRDGSKGRGGCIYCNNHSFSPSVAREDVPVADQLEAGKRFFGRKYPDMRYLAYFQSYTNTYDSPQKLMRLYREALAVDGIEGLIIGTRPDCVSDELLSDLSALAREHYVMIEYGAESSHDETLLRVNRCHTWADTVSAVRRTTEAGIHVGLHLIMGLPGETRQMMLDTVSACCRLPIDVLKLHQLQVIKGTRLSQMADGLRLFTVEEYLDLCVDVVRLVPEHIAIERFTSSAPRELLIAPRWDLKNYEFVNLLKNRLKNEDPVCE